MEQEQVIYLKWEIILILISAAVAAVLYLWSRIAESQVAVLPVPVIMEDMDKAIKDDRKNFEIQTLLQLPLLVQEKIYEHLDDTSQKNLSHTCTVYRDLISEMEGVSIQLSSNAHFTQKDLKYFRNTHFKCLVFKDHSKKTSDKNFGQNIFDEIFRFPLELQKVIFCQIADARWVFDVLSKCCNIHNLRFDSNSGITGDLKAFLLSKRDRKELVRKSRGFILAALCGDRGTLREIYFKKLTFVTIDFRARGLRDEEFINIICLIKSFRSDALKRLFIIVSPMSSLSEIEYLQVCWILGEFFEFHDKTLRDVSISISVNFDKPVSDADEITNRLGLILSGLGNENRQTESNEIQGQGDTIDEKRKSVEEKVKMVLALREKFQSIGKKSKLSFFCLEIPVMFHWDFWYSFIENLSRLCTLHLICSTNFKILKNGEIVHSSYKSLKRLRLSVDLKNPFDCAGIAECERLEEFYLFNRALGDQQGLNFPNEANVKNVHLIPAGLKSLGLGNVVVATKDINKALSKQNNLDTFAMMNQESFHTEMGCDYKTVKKLFRMRYLQSCLIFQFRCKTKAIHSRTLELLESPFNANMDSVLKEFYVPGFPTPLALDITSTEVYRRYFWKNNFLYYAMRFNDEDPYL